MNLKPKQQRFVNIYIIPVTIAILLMVTIWFTSAKYKFNNVDLAFGYLAIAITMFAFGSVNKMKWLPLPDGSYVHRNTLIDNVSNPPYSLSIRPPANYTYSFYITTSSKISSIVLGSILIAAGLYILGDTWYFLPALTIIGGSFLIHSGYKDFKNKLPQLKLAKEGLWTQELGFRTWSSISHIEFKVTYGRSTQTFLEIYLNNSLTNYADQRLSISDLTNKEQIKPTIRSLYRV